MEMNAIQRGSFQKKIKIKKTYTIKSVLANTAFWMIYRHYIRNELLWPRNAWRAVFDVVITHKTIRGKKNKNTRNYKWVLLYRNTHETIRRKRD